jgi:hypothetical protein
MYSKEQKRLVFAFLVILAGFTAVTSAQSFKATVVGTVVDPSGAIIPGATVTIVQEGTGLTLTATSGGDGSFSLPQLPPGRYELSVELDGFRKFVIRCAASRRSSP